MDSILKMGLVFFVCLLSFAVGTFVGKKFSDYNHQVAVYEPKQENNSESEVAATEEGAATTETTAQEGDKAKMTDADVAEIAKEFATPGEGTEATGREPASDATSDKGGFAKVEGHQEIPVVDEKPELKAPAKNEKHEAKVVDTKKEAISEKTETAAVKVAEGGSGQYTIQVISLANEKEAKDKASELKNENFVAFYVPAKVNGKTWYRVNIGLFSNAEEAKKFKSEKLATKSEFASALVQKVVRNPSSL